MTKQRATSTKYRGDAEEPGRHRPAWRGAVVAAMAVVLLSGAAARADEEDDDPPHITVRGAASAPLVPDVAVLRLALGAEDADAAAALKAAAAAVAAITEAAVAQGIAAADVAQGTTTLERAAASQGAPETARPYRAVMKLRLRLRDPAKVGAVLAALAAKDATVGATRVEGVDYGVADPAALLAKLTGLAVADARRRAEAAAAAAGVKLGPLLSIEPPDEPAGGSRLDRVPGGKAGTVSTTVELSYEIER